MTSANTFIVNTHGYKFWVILKSWLWSGLWKDWVSFSMTHEWVTSSGFFVAKLTFCSSLPLLNSLWWTLFHLFHTVYGTGRVSVIRDCKQTPNSFHKIQISTWFQHRRQFYVFRTVNMPTPVFTIKKYTYSVNLNTMGDLCQLVLQLGDCGKLLNTLKSVVLTICRAKE